MAARRRPLRPFLVNVERERRVAAERLAAERAARVEDLRTLLRMLDVGWTPPQPVPAAVAAPVEPARENWWERRRQRRDGQVSGDVSTLTCVNGALGRASRSAEPGS